MAEALIKDGVNLLRKVFTNAAGELFYGIAPRRIEILGNHTDYNKGFILAAAIDK